MVDGKKSYYALGSYLPKMPSYNSLAASKDGSSPSKSDTRAGTGQSLPDYPTDTGAAVNGTTKNSLTSSFADTLRRRGVSIETNSIASALYKRMGLNTSTDPSSPNDARRNTGRSTTSSGSNNSLSPHMESEFKVRKNACVSTVFGTGTVVDIRPEERIYVIQLASGVVASLTEEAVLKEIKSIAGERVKTRWGLATVEDYLIDEDMYMIALDWRWDDDHVFRMKATTKKFEKIPQKSTLVQTTKNRLLDGYSAFQKHSANFNYANVMSRINTKTSSAQHDPKALTAYGVCTLLEIRDDKVMVVKTPMGAIAYLQRKQVTLLHRLTHFSHGDAVKTPYGFGIVERFRDEDQIYEIKVDLRGRGQLGCDKLFMSDAMALHQLELTTANNYNERLSSLFEYTKKSMFSASAVASDRLSNVRARVSTMTNQRTARAKYPRGERVVTPFGSGFIVDCRVADKVYEISLRRLRVKAYCQEDQLSPFPYERVTHLIVNGKTIQAPEIPSNVPEHRRKSIINAAIQSARQGKAYDN